MNRHAQWVARVAASAVIRRLVFAIMAALIGTLAMCGKAEASCSVDPSDSSAACTYRDEAYAFTSARLPRLDNYCGGVNPTARNVIFIAPNSYNARFKCGSGAYSNSAFGATWELATPCPPGGTWNEATKQCDMPNDCANAAPLENKAGRGNLPICSGGCTYAPVSEPGDLSIHFGDYAAGSTWKPTGVQCATPKAGEDWDPNKSTCVSGPTVSECVKPDGSHCVTSNSSGRTYCWTPGELGHKETADGKGGGDRQKTPTPNTPPPGLKDPTSEGGNQGGTTINGDQYNTTNYGGSGNSGGQPNTGLPGDTNGDGKADGNDGKGEGDDDGDGPGAPGAGLVELFDGESRTVGDVFSDFRTRIEGAPIVSVGGDFLTVNVSGACPIWTVPGTAFWEPLEFRGLCEGPLADALGYGAYLLLAVAAYKAFQIGFY